MYLKILKMVFTNDAVTANPLHTTIMTYTAMDAAATDGASGWMTADSAATDGASGISGETETARKTRDMRAIMGTTCASTASTHTFLWARTARLAARSLFNRDAIKQLEERGQPQSTSLGNAQSEHG